MRRLLPVVFACLVTAATTTDVASAQPTGPPAAGPSRTASDGASGTLPVSLDRIRRELSRPAPRDTLRLPTTPTFTVVVEQRLPLLDEFFGGEGWTFGPAPSTGMSHRDFLDLVTPPYMRPYGSSVNGDLVQVLATSLATAYAMQGGANIVRSWLKARREAEAKKEVEATLRQIEAQPPKPPVTPTPPQ